MLSLGKNQFVAKLSTTALVSLTQVAERVRIYNREQDVNQLKRENFVKWRLENVAPI